MQYIRLKTTRGMRLTEEKETLFITLYAKALDSRLKHSILRDTTAYDLLNTIEYDFMELKGEKNNLTVVRAKQYDDWTTEFIRAQANAVVVYLGCGLDTRNSRINPSSHIRWFDVDYPEVIKLREAFYSEKNGYQMIGLSLIDRTWLEKIPNDRPTLIITEGVLEYLTPEDVKILLNRLTDYFKHGEVILDILSSFAVTSAKKKFKSTKKQLF